ncbi:MAG: tRNA uridine-5-carboxymethylaminomethyl(34) synthesis GTPase MnmE [Oscillospiraceae bacterium]|jgi:tRNA modification GTPase|nr:tRNA uridine-5-carboxymethylaminomethyl(34) synthesis GTPase MnmE [Oscillospiraceae bacterium]
MAVIAAIATPQAAGGIGIVRISGEGAFAVADAVFRAGSGKKLCELPGYRAAFGGIVENGERVDEAVALVFRAPKSYTGEDVVELSCHGGLYVTQRVLRLVLAAGAAPAGPGEFTKRAFLNGKIDLAEAEAVMGIISAHGEQALSAARAAKEGALSRKIGEIASLLVARAAELAVWADYPDEDVPAVACGTLLVSLQQAENELQALLDAFDAGQAVTEGVDTVICGRPNVGKSTLMNLLTGRERSIVTAVAGTTRDIVEETVRLQNIVLRLADTAGLRQANDLVEQIGVARAKERMDNAALILAVFDSSSALDREDNELLTYCSGRRAVAVVNKIDLDAKLDLALVRRSIEHVVEISAVSGAGKESLEKTIAALLGTDKIDPSAAMLATERQRRCCEEALAGVREAVLALQGGMTLDAVNVSLDYAINHLLTLTGEKATEAVVNEVFSRFCVGK